MKKWTKIVIVVSDMLSMAACQKKQENTNGKTEIEFFSQKKEMKARYGAFKEKGCCSN